MSENQNCIFCGNPEIVIQNELAFAHYDSYPVNTGHCLIIPHRHVAGYFEATVEEKAAIWALVDEMKSIIDEKYNPDGYNVGVNIGAAAGQSVPHLHIHMIPRYKGDMEDPRGGVRGVIPHKQKYVRGAVGSEGGSDSGVRVKCQSKTPATVGSGSPAPDPGFLEGEKNHVKTGSAARRQWLKSTAGPQVPAGRTAKARRGFDKSTHDEP